MKRPYPPEYYPIPAIQHTRAVVALTAACCNYGFVEHATPPKFAVKSIENIHKWADECRKQTSPRKVSAGARRSMNTCFNIWADYLSSGSPEDTELQRRCGAIVLAAQSFIEGVKNTCPIYWDGEYSKAWTYLLRNIDTLSAKLLDFYTGIEDEGFDVYMKSACSMDGLEDEYTKWKEYVPA